MKRKMLRILFALVLVVSFSLIPAIPAVAADINVPATHATIQAAIDAANPGDTIIVAAGTYAENLVIDKALTLKSADGAATTIIDASATVVADQRGAIQIAATISDVTIGGTDVGFTIIAPDAGNQYGVEVGLNCDRATIQDNIISGAVQVGIHIWGAGADAHEDITVKDNTITSTLTEPAGECYGIITAPISQALNLVGTASLIDGNTISGFSGCAIYLDGLDGDSTESPIVISNNTLHTNTRHGLVVIGREVKVTGNIIYGNTLNGLTIAQENTTTEIDVTDNNTIYNNTGWGIRIYSGTSTAITVDNNNIYSNTAGGLSNAGTGECPAENNWWGNATGPANTLKNPAGTGDTVSTLVDFVPWLDAAYDSGTATYLINNSTTSVGYETIQAAIDAADAGATITVAPGTYTETLTIDEDVTLESTGTAAETIIENTSANMLDVTATGVTIDGFTINGDGSTTSQRGLYVRKSGVTIQNNIFTNILNDNICVFGEIDAITSGTISNNTFTGAGATFEDYRAGIAVETYASNISGITITGNTLTGYGSANTSSAGSGAIKVAETDGAGVTSSITITSNTMTNSFRGLTLYVSNGKALVGIDVDSNTITNNYSGVVLESGASVTATFDLSSNTITGNVLYGVDIQTDTALSGDQDIKYNTISGNGGGIYIDTVDATVVATHNYWGSDSGPEIATLNPSGAGDSITAHASADIGTDITYAPWLFLTTAANSGDTVANIIANEVPAYANSVALSTGWNTFSVPIGLDGQYNTWAELYTLTSANYTMAYRFNPSTQAFWQLPTPTPSPPAKACTSRWVLPAAYHMPTAPSFQFQAGA